MVDLHPKRKASQLEFPGLPDALAKRVCKEALENDAIYRSRALDELDLSQIHYGHAQMLEWAFRQVGSLKGRRILDVGIGDGYSSVQLALAGAEVTGIEVSRAALERAAALGKRNCVKMDLQQMPGEDLRFADGSFDGILCISAFHHMDLERAASEFARVLKHGGRAVLIEPLATNPPAWLYRRIGRYFRREATSEERPLRGRDVEVLRPHFRKVRCQGMFLLSVGLFGLDRMWDNKNRFMHGITKAAFRWVRPLDERLLRLPGLQRIAWKIAIVAER